MSGSSECAGLSPLRNNMHLLGARTASTVGLSLISTPSIMAVLWARTSSRHLDPWTFASLLLSVALLFVAGVGIIVATWVVRPWKRLDGHNSNSDGESAVRRSALNLCFMGTAALMLFLTLDFFDFSGDAGEIMFLVVKPILALSGILGSTCCWLGGAWRYGWISRIGVAIQVVAIIVAIDPLGSSLLNAAFPWLLMMGFHV